MKQPWGFNYPEGGVCKMKEGFFSASSNYFLIHVSSLFSVLIKTYLIFPLWVSLISLITF